MIAKVTGPRRLENGLVVPGKFAGINKERGKRTKIKGTDNAHKRTLQAHGDGNNCKRLNGKESVLLHV